MEFFFLFVVSFIGSLLSFYSGFGLITVLTPAMVFFFPLPIAIALTALIHLFHSVIRTILLWKSIEWKIAIRFGIAAAFAAFPGALLLERFSQLAPIETYSFLGIAAHISLLGILIGSLMLFVAVCESKKIQMPYFRNLYAAGVLSGFLGGLSGYQGAFRSAFLSHVSLEPKVFVGTSAIISTAVDIVRLVIYGASFNLLLGAGHYGLITAPMIGALLGILLGFYFLKQMTIEGIQKVISIFLYLVGILLIFGIL